VLPSWVGVVSALSLVIIALATTALAVASVVSGLRMHAFVRAIEHMAGAAIGDVRQLIDSIKGEADALVGTSRDIRERIVSAADAAERRLTDLDALVEVVQEEVEDTVLDTAATLRNVRRGLSLWQWGRKVFKGKKKKKK